MNKPRNTLKTLEDIKTTDGTTDIVISAVTAWTMTPDENLLIFMQGDTIFEVASYQSEYVQKELRRNIG